MKYFSIFTIVVAIAVHTAHGYGRFRDLLPNGWSVPSPCPNETWLAVGHKVPLHGSLATRNTFADDWRTAGAKWTYWLCTRDSDGDGRTNGEELGDPDCSWTSGRPQYSASGHPGICEPIDSEECQEKNDWLTTANCPELARLTSATYEPWLKHDNGCICFCPNVPVNFMETFTKAYQKSIRKRRDAHEADSHEDESASHENKMSVSMDGLWQKFQATPEFLDKENYFTQSCICACPK